MAQRINARCLEFPGGTDVGDSTPHTPRCLNTVSGDIWPSIMWGIFVREPFSTLVRPLHHTLVYTALQGPFRTDDIRGGGPTYCIFGMPSKVPPGTKEANCVHNNFVCRTLGPEIAGTRPRLPFPLVTQPYTCCVHLMPHMFHGVKLCSRVHSPPM